MRILAIVLCLLGTVHVASSQATNTPQVADMQRGVFFPASVKRFTESLNGQWSFKYIAESDVGADSNFYAPQTDVSYWKTIPVPANWELHGFAEPNYALDLKEGTGLYRRAFRVPVAWKGRKTFLRFDGVAYAFELWVNGKRIGRSTASAYNPHTFDVTDALNANGENTVALKVITKPLGYEFDVNDDWALSGIFRDVTLFSVPQTHIQDITTSTKIAANGAADFSVSVAVNAFDAKIRAKLIDAKGKTVGQQEINANTTGVIHVEKPSLWTAETPSLYSLQIELLQGKQVLQTIEERVGLREITIVDKVLKLNGRPIKLRGVNHHDIEPPTGRAVTEQQMRRDLELVKRGNINFVRTSHYPPHPRLIELCDEMGFYVMDEVSIGKGEEHLEKASHRANILARIEPTITRDKNRASVIVWSIGNENPVTEVEMDAGRLAKKLDPSRPICYPKIGSYFAANYQKIPDFVDIYAPHYPTNSMMVDYIKNLQRPTIFTEYAHALGLATDRIQDQWEIMQSTPHFAGGAIWHFHDQGILRKSDTPVDRTKPTLHAWIDQNNYYDKHGNEGTDGIVYSDRTPQTDFWLTRKVYSPIQIKQRSAAVTTGAQTVPLAVENRYDFRSLAGVKLSWSMKRNGAESKSGVISLNALSRETETLSIPINIPSDISTDVLSLEFKCTDETGMQITEGSVRLDVAGEDRGAWINNIANAGNTAVSETAGEIKITNSKWALTADRASGALSIKNNTGQTIVEGIYPHASRKMTIAEQRTARSAGTWRDATLTKVESPQISVAKTDTKIILKVSGRYPRPDAPEQSFTGGYQAEILANGTLSISYDYTPTNAKGKFTEAGLSLVLPAEMTEFRWIGQGPYPGYPGKDRLNEFGIFHLSREDLNFQGNRRRTELALLTTVGGGGVAVVPSSENSREVSVERQGERVLISHNAVISSPGNKGTQPETFIDAATTGKINGGFTLVPLDNNWPAALTKWFGKPAAAKTVFRPFYHSYDQ